LPAFAADGVAKGGWRQIRAVAATTARIASPATEFDEYILREGLDAPEDVPAETIDDGYRQEQIAESRPACGRHHEHRVVHRLRV